VEDGLPTSVVNKFGDKGIRCKLSFEDLRSMCPISHTQDSYQITLDYVPNRLLIETNSFEEYLLKYEKKEILQEELSNTIMLDVILMISPKWLKVELKRNIRRGIHNTVVQEWSETDGFHHSPKIGVRGKLTDKLKVDIPFKSEKHSRITIISGGNKDLATPTFFPAVSSRQSFDIRALLELMLAENYPRLYISAYDIYENPDVYDTNLILAIDRNFWNGCTIMIDSGCFESYHKGDKNWTQGKYKEAINKFHSDYYMAFDPFPQSDESKGEYYKDLMSNLNASRGVQSDGSILIAILHGSNPTSLVDNLRCYLGEYNEKDTIIAVPERECGESLSERCLTISNIRRAFTDFGVDPILHILGCGDPVSISAYVYSGADSFDSAEWTQYLVDPIGLKKLSISQLELIKCDCRACELTNTPPNKRALLHNLLFYQNFMTKLRDMIKYGTLRDFLITSVGKDIVSKIDGN